MLPITRCSHREAMAICREALAQFESHSDCDAQLVFHRVWDPNATAAQIREAALTAADDLVGV